MDPPFRSHGEHVHHGLIVGVSPGDGDIRVRGEGAGQEHRGAQGGAQVVQGLTGEVWRGTAVCEENITIGRSTEGAQE